MKRVTRTGKHSADITQQLQLKIFSASLDVIIARLKELNLNYNGKDSILRDRLLRYEQRVIGIPDVVWNELTDIARPSPPEIEKIIKNFDSKRVVKELETNNCSTRGSVLVQKDRLARFYANALNFKARWSTSDYKENISDIEITNDTEPESMPRNKHSKYSISKRQAKHRSKTNKKMDLTEDQTGITPTTTPVVDLATTVSDVLPSITPTQSTQASATQIMTSSSGPSQQVLSGMEQITPAQPLIDNIQETANPEQSVPNDFTKDNQIPPAPEQAAITIADLKSMFSEVIGSKLVDMESNISKLQKQVNGILETDLSSGSSRESNNSRTSFVSSTIKSRLRKPRTPRLSPIYNDSWSSSSVNSLHARFEKVFEKERRPISSESENDKKLIKEREEFKKVLNDLKVPFKGTNLQEKSRSRSRERSFSRKRDFKRFPDSRESSRDRCKCKSRGRSSSRHDSWARTPSSSRKSSRGRSKSQEKSRTNRRSDSSKRKFREELKKFLAEKKSDDSDSEPPEEKKLKKLAKSFLKSKKNSKYSSSSSFASDSSSSSPDDNSSSDYKSKSKKHKHLHLEKTFKILKSFDLKFHGNENENATLFLEELSCCLKCTGLDKGLVLQAIPRILFGQAKKWWVGEKRYLTSWSKFKQSFRENFIPTRNDGKVLEDLYGRNQGEDESVLEFLHNFRAIAAHFKKPPSNKRLVELAIRRLLPNLREKVEDKRVKTFKDLLYYGRKCERNLHESRKYVAPRSKELMHIKYGAYKPKSKKNQENAASTSEVKAVIVDPDSEDKSKPKSKGKDRNRKSSKSKDENAAVAFQPPLPKPSSQSGVPEKPFPGCCSICNEYGHKGFFCPHKNGRQVCVGCGKLNMIISNCERCAEYRKRRAAENAQKANAKSPASGQQD